MPQLDRYLVFSEIFWFLVFFLGVYFFVYYFVRRFFYVLRGRTLIHLISANAAALLREERRCGLVLVPWHVENRLLRVGQITNYLYRTCVDVAAYKQALSFLLLAEPELEQFSTNFICRIALARPMLAIG